jgi:hypothetical protein
MDRLRLGRAVVEAMNAKYDAKFAFEKAKVKVASIEDLSRALRNAKSAVEAADRAKLAYNTHVAEHHCSDED